MICELHISIMSGKVCLDAGRHFPMKVRYHANIIKILLKKHFFQSSRYAFHFFFVPLRPCLRKSPYSCAFSPLFRHRLKPQCQAPKALWTLGTAYVWRCSRARPDKRSMNSMGILPSAARLPRSMPSSTTEFSTCQRPTLPGASCSDRRTTWFSPFPGQSSSENTRSAAQALWNRNWT